MKIRLQKKTDQKYQAGHINDDLALFFNRL